jgi:hypothetical protein
MSQMPRMMTKTTKQARVKRKADVGAGELSGGGDCAGLILAKSRDLG